jgi:guanylate cyclase
MSREIYVNAHDTGELSVGIADLLVNSEIPRPVCDPVNAALGPETISVVLDNELRLFYSKMAEFGLENQFLSDGDSDACSQFAISRAIIGGFHALAEFVSEAYRSHHAELTQTGSADPITNENLNDPSFIHRAWVSAVDNVRLMDVSALQSSGESGDIILPLLVVLVPALIAVVALPSLLYMTGGVEGERERILGVLGSFSEADRETASGHILASGFGSEDLVSDLDVAAIAPRSAPYLMSLLCVAIAMVLILVPLVRAPEVSTTFSSIQHHSSMHNLLHMLLAEAGEQALLLALFAQYEKGNGTPPAFWSTTEALASLRGGLADISLVLDLLTVGYGDVVEPLDIYVDVDKLRYTEKCVTPESAKYQFEVYRCLSLARITTYLMGLIEQQAAGKGYFDPRSPELVRICHVLDTRLALGVYELRAEYDIVFSNYIVQTSLELWIFFGVAAFVTLLGLAGELRTATELYSELETTKSLLMRVPATSFPGNPIAVNFMFDRRIDPIVTVKSGCEALCYSSPDATLSVNKIGVIESVNPVAVSVFGFSSEQMLGQDLGMLFNPNMESNQQLYEAMSLMRMGQSPLQLLIESTGSKDNGTIIKLEITLLAFAPHDRMAVSYALICRDMREELELRGELANATAEANHLFRALIPLEIETAMAEQRTSVESRSTAIAMLNIAMFSSFVQNTAPAGIMTTISCIYKAFQKRIVDYPGVTQLKVAGDVYVIAAGFFDPDYRARSATKVVQCALECHDLLEQVNLTLVAGLTLRIGAHLGGSLFLTVQGNSFSALGSPLETVRILESKSLDRTVNISDTMYESLSRTDFDIEPHEKIMVRGEGEKMTYSVGPGKRVAGSGSRYQITQSFGVSASESTHMSMFQVPSLVQLMGTDITAMEPAETYAPPTLDFLINPV